MRYADDFVVTSNDRDLLEEQIKPTIREFLAERGLSLSEEKTKITQINDGFDFLGQNVRKYKGKLLIMSSDKSVSTLLHKVKDVSQCAIIKCIKALGLSQRVSPIDTTG